MEQIEEAHAEQAALNEEPDYEKIQLILTSGWKDVYNALDDEHKRAFWRSFIEEIQIEWSSKIKRITDINFF